MSRFALLATVAILTAIGAGARAQTATTPPSATTKPAIGIADYDAASKQLDAQDPNAPQAMNAHLQYADFLTNATTGDCHVLLDAAQAQLDFVASRPAMPVLLPLGRAELDDGAYRIDTARAACDPSQRQSQLEQALETARKAVGVHRDALDYQGAAIMQFNVAATLQALGDTKAAIAALETTIAMDREFGFRDDGQDNIRLLQHWQGGDESDAHIAALMKDFPAPLTTKFQLAWKDSDAKEDIAVTEDTIAKGAVVESRGTIALQRHVRQKELVGKVSYDPATASASMGAWPKDSDSIQRVAAGILFLDLLETPGYQLRDNGDFDQVHDTGKVRASVLAAVPAADFALIGDLKSVLDPDSVGTETEEQYSLETATWAGATLEQGVWYQMKAPLYLPGLALGRYYMVTHDIAFSYARQVPCAPDDAAKSCAEIVLRATPDPEDYTKIHVEISKEFHLPDSDALQYWSSFNMRLVVRPKTLEPVLSDVRQSCYVVTDGQHDSAPVTSSERVVTSLAYQARAASSVGD